jgi:ABC-type nitrate/sulfonate/bicarbonate transport system substrate-binding protein
VDQDKPLATRSLDRRAFLKVSALAGAGVALGACSSAATPAPAASGAVAPGTREPAQILRFVFAPDPVWNYMKDTGIVAKYEDLYNFKIVNTTTPDEVAWFVGGHADIASLGSYEVPIVAKNTGAKFTIFAKYNATRNTFFVKADSPYKTIQDLKGKKIGVIGPGSSTLAWGAMFKDLYGLDYTIGGGDFELLVQEYASMPPLVIKGELAACGERRLLNEQDYGTCWEFYRNNYDPEKKFQGLMCNDFVALTDWYEKNPKAVQMFLAMWQEGVDAWNSGREVKETIITAYPDQFAVSTPEEMKWLVDYIEGGHDWFVKDVTLNDAWNKLELNSLDVFRKTGRIDKDVANPTMAVVPIKPL